MDQKREFNFLLVDHSLYIKLTQNLLGLFIYLYFRGKPFHFLERKTSIKLIDYFPPLVRIYRVIEFTYVFLRRRGIYYKSQNAFPIISSEFRGNCLLVLRQGEHKIINFKKKEVITVFPSMFPITEIEHRISKLRKAEKCNLAPVLINYDLMNRFSKENYINLNRPSYTFDNAEKFYFEIFPIIENIMTMTNPKVVILQQYIQNKAKCFHSLINTISSYNGISEHNVDKIITFFSNVLSKLMENNHTKGILLVYSHGDLWEGNILKDKNNSCVIDWNTLDRRSCYFDFYFIMYSQASRTKEVDRTNRLVQEMQPAFNLFYERLTKNNVFNSNVIDKIKNGNIYRHLYYLEYIILKLEEFRNGQNRHIIDFIMWIEMFESYEGSAAAVKTNAKLV